MKNTNIFKFLFLLLLATGCNDYLDEQNPGNIVAEEFYTTAEGYEALVNSTYASFREIYGRTQPYIFEAGTDMYVNSARNQSAALGLRNPQNLSPGDAQVADFYRTLYQSIQRVNLALDYLDNTEEVETLGFREGELRFMRAHHYFLLVQTFGGVPLVEERIQEAELNFPREEESVIYDFIISEMQAALELLPETAAEDGRVDQRAVNHFLAKVLLTRGYKPYGASDDFEQAAAYADDAIDGQGLTIPFGELFEPGNEDNEEIIFAVEYSPGSISDPESGGHFQSLHFGPYMGGAENRGNPYRSYGLLPTWYVYINYEPGDVRFEETFMLENHFLRIPAEPAPEDADLAGVQVGQYYDYYSENNPGFIGFYFPDPREEWTEEAEAEWRAAGPFRQYTTIVPPSPEAWEGRTGGLLDMMTPSVKKFDDPTSVFSGSGSSRRDIFIARLAETYLIAAEAYYKAGNLPEAVNRINEVRRRAGAEEITQAVLVGDNLADDPDNNTGIHFILDERARELVGEYHRWFDLMRSNTLVERASRYNVTLTPESFVGTDGELRLLRPIPASAIALNEALGPEDQNPGF